MKKIDLDGCNFTISELLFEKSPNYKLVRNSFRSGVMLGVSLGAFALYQGITNHGMTIDQLDMIQTLYCVCPLVVAGSLSGSVIFKRLYDDYHEKKLDYVFEILQDQLKTKFDLNGAFSADEENPDKYNKLILLTNDDGEHAVIQELVNQETGEIESYIYDIDEVEVTEIYNEVHTRKRK